MGRGPPEPQGGWWQDERGKWRQGGRPLNIPTPDAGERHSLDGVLVALLGALVGAVLSVPFTLWMLSGAGADAFTWLVAFPLFAFVGVLLGAGLALPVRAVWRRAASRFGDAS